MLRQQPFRFQSIPTNAQSPLMRHFAGCRRFVYNRGLELQQARYAEGRRHLGYSALCKELTGWKRDARYAWLGESHSQVLQQALEDLCRAREFLPGRRGTGFQEKGPWGSFRYPQRVKLDHVKAWFFLPKVVWIRYRKSREVLAEIKNTTVSARADRWFNSIQTEREIEAPKFHSRSAIGIDVGISRFATFSDGRYLAALNSFRSHERALRKAQRSLSRKVKFSNNWTKAKAKRTPQGRQQVPQPRESREAA